jgi:alcohol dehydrogenase
MPQIFEFNGAKKYVFGAGSLARLGTESALLGGKALLVLDPGLGEAEVENGIADSLEAAEVDHILFQDFQQEPEPEEADAAADLAAREGCDLVIGIGGGSAMDLAKAAAVLATNDGRAGDYVGVNLVPRAGLPSIMVPTTAGTGAEVTWTAVFTRRKDKAKGGINSPYMYPTTALLDPELTVTMPPEITAATGLDALCHAVESFTSVKANPMSDMCSREAIALIGEFLPIAYADGRNMEARENMLRASLLAGLGLANAGVTAVHALSYPLGAVYGIPHGLANAMLLPHVMEFNAIGSPRKFAEIAELLGADVEDLPIREAARAASSAVFELMMDLDMPDGLQDLEIPEEDLEQLAEKAMNLQRVLDNNPRLVTADDAEYIYQEAYS